MGDIAQRGNRLTFAKGGKVGRRKSRDSGTHGKDVPTMAAKGGRIGKFGGGRTNLLEELGRVEAEPSNRNRRAEISRVHGELNRGYAKGGRAGFGVGSIVAKGIKKALKPKGVFKPKKKVYPETEDLTHQKGPYVGDVGSEKRVKKAHGMSAGKQAIRRITERLGGGEEGKPHSTRAGRIAAGVRKIKRGARAKKAEGGRIGFKKGGSDKKWIQSAVKGMVKTKPCTGKKFGSKSCPPGSKRYNLAKTFKKMGKARKG